MIPVENIDIFEDSRLVISRLFYVMSQLQGDRLHCQVFYEDNVFRKDALGDLELESSTLHLQEE